MPTRQLRSLPNARVCSSCARAALTVPLRCSPTRATLGQRTVVGGSPEPAVTDHRPRHPTGELRDPLHRWHQLRRVRWVALLQLVVADEPAFLLGHQQGVAELGGALRLALADRAGIRIGK
jgi:hypothetical protein